MTNNSVLRLLLTLSILIILIGILVIIFIPFDRSYVVDNSQSERINQEENAFTVFYRTHLEEIKDTVDSRLQAGLLKTNTKTFQPDIDAKKIETAPPRQAQPAQEIIPSSPQIQNQNRALNQIRDNNSIWQQRQARYQNHNDYQMLMLRNNPWSPHYQPPAK